MADEVAVEVQTVMQVILGRRREACFDFGGNEQVEFFGKLAFHQFHSTHIFYALLDSSWENSLVCSLMQRYKTNDNYGGQKRLF